MISPRRVPVGSTYCTKPHISASEFCIGVAVSSSTGVDRRKPRTLWAIAVLLARRWRPRRVALAQVILISGYTAIATALWPSLWSESLGPLLKNLPILAAALALGAIEEER